MANVPVNFNILLDKHPSWRDIRSMVSGIPDYVDNTCAVQLSYGLNRAGAGIENYDFPDAMVATGKVRAFTGGDGMNYIFAVPDMRVYLNNRFGIAENYQGSKQKMIDKIKGRQGILAFGHFHIDLWTKTDIQRPWDYRDVLWSDKSVQLRGIFFWEVTSKWGF